MDPPHHCCVGSECRPPDDDRPADRPRAEELQVPYVAVVVLRDRPRGPDPVPGHRRGRHPLLHEEVLGLLGLKCSTLLGFEVLRPSMLILSNERN